MLMKNILIITFILINEVICSKNVNTRGHCVTYNFENDFDTSFSNKDGVCRTMDSSAGWHIGYYSSVGIEAPDPLSTTFMSPSKTLSCTTSAGFPIATNGLLEVNVYLELYQPSDQIVVFVNEKMPSGNDATLKSVIMTQFMPGYYHGWHTFRLDLDVNINFVGYISLTGSAADDSLILVDSFCYKELSQNATDCVIYVEEPKTSTSMFDISTTVDTHTTETSGVQITAVQTGAERDSTNTETSDGAQNDTLEPTDLTNNTPDHTEPVTDSNSAFTNDIAERTNSATDSANSVTMDASIPTDLVTDTSITVIDVTDDNTEVSETVTGTIDTVTATPDPDRTCCYRKIKNKSRRYYRRK